jgi:hypothetical protein
MNRILVGTAIVAAALVPLAGCSSYYTGKLEKPLHAKAVIAGPGITGEAHLYQEYEGRVRIKLNLEGTPESKLKRSIFMRSAIASLSRRPKGTLMGMSTGQIRRRISRQA